MVRTLDVIAKHKVNVYLEALLPDAAEQYIMDNVYQFHREFCGGEVMSVSRDWVPMCLVTRETPICGSVVQMEKQGLLK